MFGERLWENFSDCRFQSGIFFFGGVGDFVDAFAGICAEISVLDKTEVDLHIVESSLKRCMGHQSGDRCITGGIGIADRQDTACEFQGLQAIAGNSQRQQGGIFIACWMVTRRAFFSSSVDFGSL